MALEVEGVVDGGVDTEKALGGASRLETLHFALASSKCLMRVFGSIFLRSPCSCGQFSQQTLECRGVERSLSVTSNFGTKPCFLRLAHQPQRPSIAPTLNQYVEDLALVIDGTAQIHPLAGDPNHHLVEVPAIPRPRTALA
jgi:hypothetical protein